MIIYIVAIAFGALLVMIIIIIIPIVVTSITAKIVITVIIVIFIILVVIFIIIMIVDIIKKLRESDVPINNKTKVHDDTVIIVLHDIIKRIIPMVSIRISIVKL